MSPKDKEILVVKATWNEDIQKFEYVWEYPNNVSTTRLLGIIDMIKYDLLRNWEEQTGGIDDKDEL